MNAIAHNAIDVFLDIENVGAMQALTLRLLLRELPAGLLKRDLAMRKLYAAASPRSVTSRYKSCCRQSVSAIFRNSHHRLVWTHGTADDAIMQEIVRRSERNDLARNLMLISDDSDFRECLHSLRASGYFIFVSGRQTESSLATEAHLAVPLKELLEVELSGGGNYISPAPPLNPLPL